MADKGFMTVEEFAADHSRITPKDVRQCIKGTHPTLPPLAAKLKDPAGPDNQAFLISREAGIEWRAACADA